MNIHVVFVAIAVYFGATTISTLGHVMMKLHADSRNLSALIILSHKYKYIFAAFALFIIGGVIDVSVNRFIPFYIRACFAALDIPIYVIFARFLLNEVLDNKQTLGVCITVIGCTSAVLFGTREVVQRSKRQLLHCLLSERVVILISVTVPIYLACSFAVRGAASRKLDLTESSVRRNIYLTCAVFSSAFSATWASLMVRAVSELAHHSITDIYTISAGLILVSMSILQLVNMTEMHALFNSILSMPFYLTCNSVGIVLLSTVIFDEVPAYPVLFALSMAVGFLGIAFIIHKPSTEITESKENESISYENERLLAL